MTKRGLNKKSIFLITSFLALLLLVAFLFLGSPIFEVKLSTQESHLEIGTKAETDPHFYLSGHEIGIVLSHVDTSSV